MSASIAPRIRDAKEEDMPEILEIYNDIIQNSTAVFSYAPHTLEMRLTWWKDRIGGGFPVHVATDPDTGKILGFASYGPFRAWRGFKYTVENSVYCHRESRGRGVGKLLLKATIEHAQANSIHAIVAGIEASNEVSIGLHKQFGFVETGTMKQVGFKFNKWLDLSFLQLTFENSPIHPCDDIERN